jgi:hypothetical protein
MTLRILPSLLPLAMASLAVAQTGAVSGSVTSSADGSPVQGATVTYRRLVNYLPNTGINATNPQLAPGEAYFTASSQTGAQGEHSASGLPSGNYQVCIGTPDAPFLDPCQWATAPHVYVGAGQAAALDIVAVLGVYLAVTINDPQGLLPTSESGPLDFPHLTVGVYFGSGAFLAAQRTSVGAGTQTYSMAIPTGVPLNLWLFSRYVYLANAGGNSFSTSGAQIPFTAVAGATSSFVINVTGAVPATTPLGQQ